MSGFDDWANDKVCELDAAWKADKAQVIFSVAIGCLTGTVIGNLIGRLLGL